MNVMKKILTLIVFKFLLIDNYRVNVIIVVFPFLWNTSLIFHSWYLLILMSFFSPKSFANLNMTIRWKIKATGGKNTMAGSHICSAIVASSQVLGPFSGTGQIHVLCWFDHWGA